MRTHKHYTQEELDGMIEMIGQGATYEEIAEMFGRNANGVAQKLNQVGHGMTAVNRAADAEERPAEPIKEKTLNDYSVRELIKHLYDRGCRIRNNKVMVVIEKTINICDIINNG